jgi:hypothetical protein
MGFSKHSLFFILGVAFSLLGLWYVSCGIDFGYMYTLDYREVMAFSALAVVLLIFYLSTDLLGKQIARWGCVIAAIACLVVIPTITSIHHRLNTKPYYFVHDNPIQVEEAIKLLLNGKNPYGADYSNTPMSKFPYNPPVYDFAGTPEPPETKINPALFHTVSLPFGIMAVLPWYVAWDILFYWFDARIVYLMAYIALVIIAAFLVPKDSRIDFVPLFALNPLFASYVIEGHNDTLVILLVVITLILAKRRKFILSAIPLGLALATKQSSWPFALVYAIYLWFVMKKTLRIEWMKIIGLTAGIAFLCIAPFFFWNMKAFLADTVGFTNGTVPYSYPIRGIGFSVVLVALGILPNTQASYPSGLMQLIFGLPVVVLGWYVLQRQPTLRTVVSVSGLLLLVLLFFSRFFIDNYVGSVLVYLLLGYFMAPS